MTTITTRVLIAILALWARAMFYPSYLAWDYNRNEAACREAGYLGWVSSQQKCVGTK